MIAFLVAVSSDMQCSFAGASWSAQEARTRESRGLQGAHPATVREQAISGTA